MISSMTGYGKSMANFSGKNIIVEVKSLNSKQLDLSVKIPNIYHEKELRIRDVVSQKLLRGKIDLSVRIQSVYNADIYSVNEEIATRYYEQLTTLSSKLNITQPVDYLSIIAKMPDVVNTLEAEVHDEEYDALFSALDDALSQLQTYRDSEGEALKEDFITRIHLIENYLKQVPQYESARIDSIKSRILTSLATLGVDYDKNRFEQELIYYIEKLDITEEKVRLANHCGYFLKTLLDSTSSQGKQLGFISQEIGREINTIGSKANDVNIQQIVVKMKDELEKIKEQLANIL